MTLTTLTGFFSRLQCDGIPEEVLAETRRVLLDSIACIVAARATEAGRVSERFAGLLGGLAQPAGSAYAYGRLTDAMDFNEGCSGAHFGSGAVGAALALAHEPGVTGADFIAGMAAGFELAGRVQNAIGPYYSTVDGRQSFSAVWGIATPIVYAAAGTATRMLRFDADMTAQAWGLAGSNTPIPVGAKWSSAVDLPNTKYCDAGWCTLAGVTGALSARFGSTGITTLLDDADGLLRMVSSLYPAHAKLTQDLGTRWCITEVGYKTWPACGLFEGSLRNLLELMAAHDIRPGDIDRIDVAVGSAILLPRFLNIAPRTFASLQFNLPHAIAMILLGIPSGPQWLSLEFAAEPHIAALRAKVHVTEHAVPWPTGSRRRANAIRVTAGAQSWFAETIPDPADTTPVPRWGDAEILSKFRAQVRAGDADRIVDLVMGLETATSPAGLRDAVERARPFGATA